MDVPGQNPRQPNGSEVTLECEIEMIDYFILFFVQCHMHQIMIQGVYLCEGVHCLWCVILKLKINHSTLLSLGSFNVTKAKLLMADDGPEKRNQHFLSRLQSLGILTLTNPSSSC